MNLPFKTEKDFLLLHSLIIILLGSLAYSNTFNAPFVFDDNINIIHNTIVKDFRYFSDPSLIDTVTKNKELLYGFKNRTVGYFTFALNYKAHGLNVFGYHLVNLLIHIANALLVYQLVILTFSTPYFKNWNTAEKHGCPQRSMAFFSALLFVGHPIQTQAVTYIIQRFAALATLFCLLSVVMYVKFRLQSSFVDDAAGDDKKAVSDKTAHWICYLTAFVSAVLAMKTKEIAFTLPVIIVLYEFMFFEGKPFKRILYLIPLLSTMLIIPIGLIGNNISLADISVGLNKALAVSSQNSISRWDYLFTQFRVIATYFRLLFLPVGQNIDYDYPIYHSFFNVPVFSSFIILLSVLILGVYLYFRSRRIEREIDYLFRVIAFGIFWFFITISVESSILPIADVIFEHRVYLPSAGFFIGISSACSLALGRFHRSRPAAGRTAALLGALLIVSLASATFARNMVWQSDFTLWKDALAKSPNKARPHSNVGVAYTSRGEIDNASREYRIATTINPDFVEAYSNLGVVLFVEKRYDEAEKELLKAVQRRPFFPTSYYNLGRVYAAQERLYKASVQYETAIRMKPDYAEAFYELGSICMQQGRQDEALRQFSHAATFKPEMPEAHFKLGLIYMNTGRIAEAVKEYVSAIDLKPDYADPYNNLGMIHTNQGRLDEAIKEYRIAIKLNPFLAEAHNNLAAIYANQGKSADAIRELKIALRIRPDFTDARNNLGRLSGLRK
jgi:Flp pilus assembly protein TadD